MRSVSLTVNDVLHELELDPRELLVYVLRERLGLTGTVVGCDTSSCGACTVLLDGESVKSCTVLGVQANGTVQDIGAQLLFQNLKHRWNYGASVQHVPYLTGYYTGAALGQGFYEQDLVLQRIFIDAAGFSAAYPFSTTKRIEAGLSATRLGFSTQIQRLLVDGAGNVYDQRIDDTTSRSSATRRTRRSPVRSRARAIDSR